MGNPSLSSLLLVLLCIISLILALAQADSDSHFEGFEAEDDDDDLEDSSIHPASLRSPPLSDPTPTPQPPPSDLPKFPPFDFWDDDEFEGVPVEHSSPEPPSDPKSPENATTTQTPPTPNPPRSFSVEIICGSFLIMFAINYFSGKRENENIALSWAAQFAAKDSIFEKNFSLLWIGDGVDEEEAPLLLKEGQTTFKYYASGRRYCQGLLATLELKSRHDLIARIYNMIVPCRDEIAFEVYMNDDAMDHVVFAMAKKKVAKAMHKDVTDLQRFGTLLSAPSATATATATARKWVADDLAVISESKEVANDLITDAVIDQVFGEKAFEKFGKGLISLHFSDQHPGIHKKILLFKFVLPAAKDMADMTRLVALVPYYIDLIGRYKLSSQARSKTEAARQKAALEAQKELRNAQQEAMQRRKAERKKMVEEAEAKLSAEAVRKKEAKERARQMKKAMPRMKMSRGA
ncbi:hypothetical protein JHK82_045663 [Glycine max]|uniref:DUF1682 family protein n=2 Tax=Glycine subgen. Soja TaxID=1462606 RepID=I1MJW1_SOYBN|nr:uncharacterized protein At5g49945 [Glycine max]XP_028207057.1 uncharacterized protein At5g49945-like [Glycine soja]KAG4937856.1 hypothetical protein JHK86_043997 [Glycine max]KAG5100611.1 hypothetical protein JHK82_045663 [Glycine max]KAH1204376.1 Uncharacterized protein GmHk_16G045350 [Glycine max]KRH06083.1 hypothetical protein GLYMA_16G003600v4 [Glycine max]RZB58892.1 hypothetical protein D0Y65_042284 [Glycine soja]|eukprot:XP_006598805.1 uncharacterized protein At5g49945 [Glycine max]